MKGRAVLDSTCLIVLERIGRLDLLPGVFDELFAPVAVRDESGIQPTWLRFVQPQDARLVAALRTQMDDGEAEVIALVTEAPLDAMAEAGFHMSRELYQEALRLAKEE